MTLAALTAQQIDQGPATGAFDAGFALYLALGLSIFAAFYGLRFARRLLGA